MSCSACAARIENALKEVPGVFEAHVNFATARSTISHHPETTKNLLDTNYVNHFQLLKIEDEWRIISKIYVDTF